ncbi:MAG TPA: malonyl-ACP O-methyltransferase BioC [Steroidobacteraceae bacterium]
MNDEQSFQLDPRQVRASFDRASRSYEAAAVLQNQVADELLSRLDTFPLQPGVVLDLGSGPGRSAARLKRKFRRATVVALDLAPSMLSQARRHQRLFHRFERICADATRLPLGDSTVDIVFSSLMLQWCDLDGAFAEVRRVLKPDGLLLFSTFGPDTLKELRAAWTIADSSEQQSSFLLNHVNQFYDMHDVGDAVVRAGLSEPVLDVDRIQLTYADTRGLMRELKAIGAHNVTEGRARGLTGKGRLQRMSAAYEAFRRDGALPATYEIVYGTAWGAQGRGATRSVEGEFRIAPGSIKRRGST